MDSHWKTGAERVMSTECMKSSKFALLRKVLTNLPFRISPYIHFLELSMANHRLSSLCHHRNHIRILNFLLILKSIIQHKTFFFFLRLLWQQVSKNTRFRNENNVEVGDGAVSIVVHTA